MATPHGPNPEDWGVDFLFINKHGLFGVQRKAVADLTASLDDGRLGSGLAKSQGSLHKTILLIEGDWKWNRQGASEAVRGFTRVKLRGVELSAQFNGMVVVHTADLSDTAQALTQLESYFARDDHTSLFTRPKARGRWGKADSEEWRWHWWQSHDGIGLGQAKKLDGYFSGRLPVEWTVTEKELLACPGIGPKRAKSLWTAFASGNGKSPL